MTGAVRGRETSTRETVELNPVFARPGEATELSRNSIPEHESLPETAYQIVHDEAMLDGNARLNLATFVGTWMDDQASKLYHETYDKNMIDKDEYPATAAIETRCWTMLADLWHAPDAKNAIGTSTIGSSEGCMPGGLALKRRWQKTRKGTGPPNLVMSSGVQVCWEKFCNYWDVEPRYVPISQEHKVLDGLQDLTVQRVVVRNGLSRDLAERFLADLKSEVAFLDKVPGPIPTEGQTPGFHH